MPPSRALFFVGSLILPLVFASCASRTAQTPTPLSAPVVVDVTEERPKRSGVRTWRKPLIAKTHTGPEVGEPRRSSTGSDIIRASNETVLSSPENKEPEGEKPPDTPSPAPPTNPAPEPTGAPATPVAPAKPEEVVALVNGGKYLGNAEGKLRFEPANRDPNAPTPALLEDAVIGSTIQGKIASDDALKQKPIEIKSKSGVVQMKAPEGAAADLAKAVNYALLVPGVVEVQLEVTKPAENGTGQTGSGSPSPSPAPSATAATRAPDSNLQN